MVCTIVFAIAIALLAENPLSASTAIAMLTDSGMAATAPIVTITMPSSVANRSIRARLGCLLKNATESAPTSDPAPIDEKSRPKVSSPALKLPSAMSGSQVL